MKRIRFFLFIVFAATAFTQAPSQTPAVGSPKTKAPLAATAVHKSTTAGGDSEPWIKLPAGVPRVLHGPVKIPFALRYEDIKIGTGAEGEPGKLWHIEYTGWRAADGIKFDSWDDHRRLAIGADGKPEFGPNGMPKMADPEPMAIPQGVGHMIPGFDYGLAGMRIGGKRRIFIPWQLAYGTHEIPDRPGHPGIPAKSDLIFDVELVAVTDLPAPTPMPAVHPGVPPIHPGETPQPNAAPGAPAHPAEPANPTEPAAKPSTSAPAQPASPAPPPNEPK